jgi:hypothetical protein
LVLRASLVSARLAIIEGLPWQHRQQGGARVDPEQAPVDDRPVAPAGGTGVCGEFEKRFKALLKDIDEEAGEVICFIDEIHTLLNLGKWRSMDAGNMIKPACIEQLVGASTLDEYRKTIEKDQALQRRFHPSWSTSPTLRRRYRSSVASSRASRHTLVSRLPTRRS